MTFCFLVTDTEIDQWGQGILEMLSLFLLVYLSGQHYFFLPKVVAMAATSSLETLFNETNLSAAEIQARLAELSHPVSSFSAEIKQDILAKIRNISR